MLIAIFPSYAYQYVALKTIYIKTSSYLSSFVRKMQHLYIGCVFHTSFMINTIVTYGYRLQIECYEGNLFECI